MKKQISTIIVENEEPDFEYLQIMLERHFPEIDVVCVVENIPDAIEKVKQEKPDLIFLDIELPPLYGFNLLEETRGLNYHTIFTTSYNKYAVKAFKFAAVHYLLKPFGLDDLKEAINFYKERIGYSEDDLELTIDQEGKESEDILLHNLTEPIENQIIVLPIYGGKERCTVKEIIWCQAQNNYTHVQRPEKRETIATKTLKDIENMLDEHNFYRVHRSYLINIDHVRKYLRGDGGEVVMSNGEKIPVARNRKNGLLSLLGLDD